MILWVAYNNTQLFVISQDLYGGIVKIIIQISSDVCDFLGAITINLTSSSATFITSSFKLISFPWKLCWVNVQPACQYGQKRDSLLNLGKYLNVEIQLFAFKNSPLRDENMRPCCHSHSCPRRFVISWVQSLPISLPPPLPLSQLRSNRSHCLENLAGVWILRVRYNKYHYMKKNSHRTFSFDIGM